MSSEIDRSSVQPIVIALLCIVAVGLAAATLSTATDPTPGGSAVFEPPENTSGGAVEPSGPDSNATINGTGAATGASVPLSTCYEPLASTPGTLVYLLAFLAVVGAIYYRFNFSAALLGGWTAFPLFMLVYFLTTNCPTPEGEGSGVGGVLSNAPAPDQTVLPVDSVPPWVLGVVIAGVLLVAVGLLYRSAGEDETVMPEEDEDEEPELDRFAAAAGRAADNIEKRNADVDNAVYEAWVEMTGLLDVDDPKTYSAGEFADTAVGLGMDESDVNELTRLFNEVRYGGKDATEREDRAVDVLRNIESAYSEESIEVDELPTGEERSTDDRPGGADGVGQ